VDVPQFPDPDQPHLDPWLAALTYHLQAAPRAPDRVVLAHSCGALLWLHHAARLTGDRAEAPWRFDRVLLVAPPGPHWRSPDVHGFSPAPLDAAGVRRAAGWTQLVVGGDDDTCPVDDAVAMAATLKIDFDVIPGGGHLDPAAGYGAWPAVLAWVHDRHARVVGNVAVRS
jgi:predicted alpha/beta hydrolase family esterase